MKCCNAFKGDNECVFVWCCPCARAAIASVDEDKKDKNDKDVNKKVRSTRRGLPEQMEYKEVRGSKTRGTYRAHTYGNIRLLGMETDENYTWRKQHKRRGGRDNIAKHSFGCGLTL